MTLTPEFIQRVKSCTWTEDTPGGPAGVVFLSHPDDPFHDVYRAARVRRRMDELADVLWLSPATERVRDIGARVTLESSTRGHLLLAEGMPRVPLSIGPEWARRVTEERLPILVFVSTLGLPADTLADADRALRTPRAQRQMRVGCTHLRGPGSPAFAAAVATAGAAS